MLFTSLLRYYTVPVLRYKWHSLVMWPLFGALIAYFGEFGLEGALVLLSAMALISLGISPLYAIANDNYTRRIEFFRALNVGFLDYFMLMLASPAITTISTTVLPMLALYYAIYGTDIIYAMLDPDYLVGLASSGLASCTIGVLLGLWRPNFSFAGGVGTGIVLVLCLGPVMASSLTGIAELLYAPPIAYLFIGVEGRGAGRHVRTVVRRCARLLHEVLLHCKARSVTVEELRWARRVEIADHSNKGCGGVRGVWGQVLPPSAPPLHSGHRREVRREGEPDARVVEYAD